ncbi:MAG: DUF5684 domain-containing protein [Candidatus Kapabacteria bacterium]|nr:DUF5684 domain-containing protein [Candidatus Kapabacteria bacterium]
MENIGSIGSSFFIEFLGIIIAIALLLSLVINYFVYGKVFEKAGYPAYTAAIPVYKTIILLKIADFSAWMILVFLLPVINLVLLAVISIRIAKFFSKSGGFAVGLVFLPYIFFPIIGYGVAKYKVDYFGKLV